MPTNRDDFFVPLAPGAVTPNERGDYRVTVMAQAENVQPFRPLGQAGSASSVPGGAVHEPRVTVQHEGDRVSSIQIQCTCGQIIELACAYEPPSLIRPEPTPIPPPPPPVAAAAPPTPAPPPPLPTPAPSPAAAPASLPENEAALKSAAKKPKAKGR